jgi:hypothetical protein
LVDERQDLVYRDAATATTREAPGTDVDVPVRADEWCVEVSPLEHQGLVARATTDRSRVETSVRDRSGRQTAHGVLVIERL